MKFRGLVLSAVLVFLTACSGGSGLNDDGTTTQEYPPSETNVGNEQAQADARAQAQADAQAQAGAQNLPDGFKAAITGSADTDGDNVDDRYDVDFSGGLDSNQNGVDDIFEAALRSGIDSNSDGIEDLANQGLVLGFGSTAVVRSDGADTANVDSLFTSAWGMGHGDVTNITNHRAIL